MNVHSNACSAKDFQVHQTGLLCEHRPGSRWPQTCNVQEKRADKSTYSDSFQFMSHIQDAGLVAWPCLINRSQKILTGQRATKLWYWITVNLRFLIWRRARGHVCAERSLQRHYLYITLSPSLIQLHVGASLPAKSHTAAQLLVEGHHQRIWEVFLSNLCEKHLSLVTRMHQLSKRWIGAFDNITTHGFGSEHEIK